MPTMAYCLLPDNAQTRLRGAARSERIPFPNNNMNDRPAQQWQGPAFPSEAGHTPDGSEEQETRPEPPHTSGDDRPILPAAPVPSAPPSAWALRILATIALLYCLQWAADFFIPLLFGILLSYTLNPIVSWIERARLPRVVGAGLVTLALIGSTALLANTLYREARVIVDELPLATWKIRSALARLDDGQAGMYEKLQAAAESLKHALPTATQPGGDEESIPTAPAPPAKPTFDLSEWLLAGSMTAAGLVAQFVVVLFIVFFGLASGNTFKRKLVKLTGPSLSQKKITVQILDNINGSIQKYMFMLLVTNVALGLASWAAFHVVGLDNPGAWAIAAALLHIIPYFGTLIAALGTGAAAFLQFESFTMMAVLVGVNLLIASLVGTLMATWMTGRIAKMNPMAVFVALLFGGWLWGIWGMLICVPMVVAVKVVSEHVENLQPLAELLGE